MGDSLVNKVGRNVPCPCGSGKKYKQCCIAKARASDLERANHREGVAKALAWINLHHKAALDDWVEQTWLAGLDDADRAGIASADARIRGIHDTNLLEQLVAEGSFPDGKVQRTVFSLLCEATDLDLDAQQRDYLKQLTERQLSLYRICATVPGQSFSLQPLAAKDGATITIEDRWVSRMLDVEDVVGLRVLRLCDNKWEVSGAVYHIPPEYVEGLLTQWNSEHEKHARSWLMIHYWLGLVAAHV